ncbi:MAG: hypothetical protein L6R41_003878 [Letrouitia leprolyta]|nr:MAG: hypothetical protein L6R41_003878 [Letrouitia leprolyta]
MAQSMEYNLQKSQESSRISSSTSILQDVQSHPINSTKPANVVKEAFDIEAVERVVANSARNLDTEILHDILDDEIEKLTTAQKARKYLLGPLNHIGSALSNNKTRNIIQNCAQVVCLDAPPGVDYHKVRNRLVLNFGLYYVSLDYAYNQELKKPDSPYPRYIKSLRDPRLPDKMKVELLGKYLQSKILEGQTRFLVVGFPISEQIAALFEEDVSPKLNLLLAPHADGDQVCLIHAYICIDGPTNRQEEYKNFVVLNRPVREKLDADGRLFMVKL